MRISNRARNLSIWFAVGIAMSPLGFNCHSRTDQSPAVSKDSAIRADDADQTVRTLASEDGAPVSESKVRVSSEALISSAKAASLGLSGKLTSSSDSVVPKGTKLFALYDNACRGKQGPLRFEAEAFEQAEDVSLAALSNEADNQDCLVRIDENRKAQWVKPVADFNASNAAPISALATTNDSRIAEARQIAFSRALQAWDWFFSGTGINRDVIVAVVDTGILYTHPDLVDNVYTDANGNHGIDFVNGDNSPLDDAGHGTHVSGIIGARAGNAIGISGIMGTRVKIMGVKVLDNEGSGTEADIVNGIRYATDQGAQVINLSLGGNFASPSIRDAMVYAAGRGVVMTVAAGNDGVSMNATTNFYAPSCYAKDIPGVLSVGSVNAVSGAMSSFSNYNPTYVWIGAPGSNGILSTYLGNTYMAIEGTSMASPAVAGAAALLVGAFRSHSITYTPADIVNLLTESARPVTGLNTFFRGGATLDVERAAKLFYSRYIMSGNGGTEIE